MDTLLIVLLIAALIGVGVYFSRTSGKATAASLEDSRAESRRWIDRLGGQVLSLDAKDDEAAKQALSDASERFNAAGAQIEQATTVTQARLAQQTASEGLYYVRAARTTLGMDPGPELPPIPGQSQAGAVTEDRTVDVDGRDLEASPAPSDRTRHYYPGGMVAGRPVPRGWYSEPWWKPALVAGAWGVGSYLVASSLFAGMAGIGGGWGGGGYDSGYDTGYQDGMTADGGDFDGGGFDGSGSDGGGFDGGFDGGGFDGGGDFGGDGGGFDF